METMPAGFATMPTRVAGEREARLKASASAMAYHNAFLDDRLRAVLPHDFVILTARSGVGKTSAALDMAISSALSERRVGVFALEAEPCELERRAKYRWLVNQAYLRSIEGRESLTYTDWLVGRCEDIVGYMEREANEWLLNNLGTVWTYYKGSGRFDADRMAKELIEISKIVEMIVLDHLHYIDAKEGDTDNRSLSAIAHTLRDIALDIGKPVIGVSHLRKRDRGADKSLIPEQDDLMGSSDLPKIATQIVALAPAPFVVPPKWWMAPTLVSVIKDRREGFDGLAALVMFDKRSRLYAEDYTLGRLIKGGTAWEQLKAGDVPTWARGHRELEIEFTDGK